MTDFLRTARIADLTKVRRNRAEKGEPPLPWMTYTPPAPYLFKPCDVVLFPVAKRDATVVTMPTASAHEDGEQTGE